MITVTYWRYRRQRTRQFDTVEEAVSFVKDGYTISELWADRDAIKDADGKVYRWRGRES
jgi:hypothetical protein